MCEEVVETTTSPTKRFSLLSTGQSTENTRAELNVLLAKLHESPTQCWEAEDEEKIKLLLIDAQQLIAIKIAHAEKDFQNPDSEHLALALKTYEHGSTAHKKSYDGIMELVRKNPKWTQFNKNCNQDAKAANDSLGPRGLQQTRNTLPMLYKDAVKASSSCGCARLFFLRQMAIVMADAQA